MYKRQVLYAPGLLFYIWARREQNEKPFNTAEAVIAAIVLVLGLYAFYQLATGHLSL